MKIIILSIILMLRVGYSAQQFCLDSKLNNQSKHSVKFDFDSIFYLYLIEEREDGDFDSSIFTSKFSRNENVLSLKKNESMMRWHITNTDSDVSGNHLKIIIKNSLDNFSDTIRYCLMYLKNESFIGEIDKIDKDLIDSIIVPVYYKGLNRASQKPEKIKIIIDNKSKNLFQIDIIQEKILNKDTLYPGINFLDTFILYKKKIKPVIPYNLGYPSEIEKSWKFLYENYYFKICNC